MPGAAFELPLPCAARRLPNLRLKETALESPFLPIRKFGFVTGEGSNLGLSEILLGAPGAWVTSILADQGHLILSGKAPSKSPDGAASTNRATVSSDQRIPGRSRFLLIVDGTVGLLACCHRGLVVKPSSWGKLPCSNRIQQ